MLKVQPDTLRDEISQVVAILTKWSESLGMGIPGDELPADETNAEIYQVQLRGELMLCSERLASLADVLE